MIRRTFGEFFDFRYRDFRKVRVVERYFIEKDEESKEFLGIDNRIEQSEFLL